MQFDPNVECLCHAYRTNLASNDRYNHRNAERFMWKLPPRENSGKRDNVYEVKVKRNHYRHYSKPYVRIDGTEGIPRRNVGVSDDTDSSPPKYTDTKQELEEISERIDIYYFDHGNSALILPHDRFPSDSGDRKMRRKN